MLTVGQTLVVSGQNGDPPLSTSSLLAKFPARPLSVRSVVTAYEKQRVVVFASLVSPRVLLSPNIRTIADLRVAATGAEARLTGSEILAVSSALRERGVSLRLVNSDLRRFAIVGTVPDLVSTPTMGVNDGNLLHVLDKYSGGEAIGGIALGLGAVLIGVALTVAAPVWVLPVGAALVGFGAGFGITAGVLDMLQDTKPAPRSDSQENTETPNDAGPDGPGGETIELPNAVAVGTPPDGLNTDGVLEQLGDFAVDFSVDLALSDLPVGFNPTTGDGLPGFGGVGDGGPDDPPASPGGISLGI